MEILLCSMTQTEWILRASHSTQNVSPSNHSYLCITHRLLGACKIQMALILQLIIPFLHSCWYYKHYQLSWSYLGHACVVASIK